MITFSETYHFPCGPDMHRSLCSKLQGSLSSSQGRRTSSLALKGISIWSSDMACCPGSE